MKQATLKTRFPLHSRLRLGFFFAYIGMLLFASPSYSLAKDTDESSVFNIGFTRLTTTDPIGGKLRFSVWYPTLTEPGKVNLGPFSFSGTKNATVAPGQFPVVILSHGKGGSDLGHRSIAIALAKAGIIAAAPLHSKDNFRDDSGSGRPEVWIGRPKQVSAVLDHLLLSENFSSSIVAKRYGIFGFSAGGYTALALLGAIPNFYRLIDHCDSNRLADPVCRYLNDGIYKNGDVFRSMLDKTASLTPSPFNALGDDRFCTGVVADPLAWVFPKIELAKLGSIPLLIYLPEIQNELNSQFHGEHVFRHSSKAQSKITNSNFKKMQTIQGAQHFSFITPFPKKIAKSLGSISNDFGDFDRDQFHAELSKEIASFFTLRLADC